MMETGSLKIVRVQSAEEIAEVVALHKKVFVDNLAGHIGRSFIGAYLENVVESSCGILYVAKEGSRIVGFVAGLTTKKGFCHFKLMSHGLGVTAWQLLVRPSTVLNILLQSKRMFSNKSDCPAQLLTIGVAEGNRKSGVGKRLIQSLEEFFKTQGVKEYKVYTDSKFKDGIKFYEDLGFVLKKQVNVGHISERLYLKRLDQT
jgi:GNAT superfamily N-acetyltransferase